MVCLSHRKQCQLRICRIIQTHTNVWCLPRCTSSQPPLLNQPPNHKKSILPHGRRLCGRDCCSGVHRTQCRCPGGMQGWQGCPPPPSAMRKTMTWRKRSALATVMVEASKDILGGPEHGGECHSVGGGDWGIIAGGGQRQGRRWRYWWQLDRVHEFYFFLIVMQLPFIYNML